MFKPWLGCLLLIIASVSRSAHAEPAVSIISEPRHHLVLENDYARVFKVDVPPHTGDFHLGQPVLSVDDLDDLTGDREAHGAVLTGWFARVHGA